MARLLAPFLLAAVVGACSPAGNPSPSPAGMSEALPALVLRGATIRETVSGDAGCPGSPLHSNAMRVELTVAGDDTRYVVYLFRWRRPADFTAASDAFADCVEQFLTEAQGEVPIDEVEASPWRAYGPGWSEEVLVMVDEALHDLARTGR